jgi:D-specific alpha-keto acid dehydrogenase
MKSVGITIYGCEKDEADLFMEFAPRLGVVPVITCFPASTTNAKLAQGNRCISVGHKATISESVLLALKNCGVHYVSTRSSGCNHIDMNAAQRLGIQVGNVEYSPGSVADYTVMLMLLAIRQAKSVVRRAESHDFRLEHVRGKELRDLTVGVLGTGRIGQAVLERLRGFGGPVLAHDRSNPATAAEHVSFHELLHRSDILTLHVPLTADTRHLIGHEQLNAMKPGAFLINTARGELVDTDALINALERGKLGGAALDVLEGEEGLFYLDCTRKPLDHPLLLRLQRMPNVLITPHTAYYTGRALRDMVENTLLNCLEFERITHVE